MARYYYDGETDLYIVSVIGNVIARFKYEDLAIKLVERINNN